MSSTQSQRDYLSKLDPALLQRAAFHIDDRYRKVLSQRLIRKEPKTLLQLSAELEISKERVRQIQGAAFEKVKREVESG